MLQDVAVSFSQSSDCTAARLRGSVLQRVAEWCSVAQCGAVWRSQSSECTAGKLCCSVLQCVAMSLSESSDFTDEPT